MSAQQTAATEATNKGAAEPFFSRTNFCVQGDYFAAHLDADVRKHGFRHSGRETFAGRWHCTSERPALDEGRPAHLVREFPAVTDDFGNLVEVAA